MTVSDTNSCRAQLSTIRPGQWRIWKAGQQTGRSATTSRERRHMGGHIGAPPGGPHLLNEDEGYETKYGCTPGRGRRARGAASNWTPSPARMTTLRCAKESAWTSLLKWR